MSQAEIVQWAQAGENLDIYQVNAIFEGSGSKKIQCMSYWKTMACVGLQTFGIITLMTLQWTAAGFDCPDVQICAGNFSQDAWVAFFFALFVSISCGDQLRTLGQYGMYKWGSGQPASVSKFWVAVGLWTNVVVLLLTWVCSTITIMTSKGIDVIVLNSVAVLFMVTLDDEIVTFADYSQVEMSIGQGSVGRCCAAMDVIGALLLKLQLLWKIPYLCGIIMFPLTVVVPVLVLGCYNDTTYINVTDCTVQPYPPVALTTTP